MSDVGTALTAMRQLLDDPKRWTQGASARSKDGLPTFPEAAYAACWCLDGAVVRTCGRSYEYDIVSHLMNEEVRRRGPYSFITWQDDPDRTHADILAFLDDLIAAEAQR